MLGVLLYNNCSHYGKDSLVCRPGLGEGQLRDENGCRGKDRSSSDSFGGPRGKIIWKAPHSPNTHNATSPQFWAHPLPVPGITDPFASPPGCFPGSSGSDDSRGSAKFIIFFFFFFLSVKVLERHYAREGARSSSGWCSHIMPNECCSTPVALCLVLSVCHVSMWRLHSLSWPPTHHHRHSTARCQRINIFWLNIFGTWCPCPQLQDWKREREKKQGPQLCSSSMRSLGYSRLFRQLHLKKAISRLFIRFILAFIFAG